MAKFSPLSFTSIQLSEQHTYFQYLAMNTYHGPFLSQTPSTNSLVSMSTNMPITMHLRLLSNTLPASVRGSTSAATSRQLPAHLILFPVVSPPICFFCSSSLTNHPISSQQTCPTTATVDPYYGRHINESLPHHRSEHEYTIQ